MLHRRQAFEKDLLIPKVLMFRCHGKVQCKLTKLFWVSTEENHNNPLSCLQYSDLLPSSVVNHWGWQMQMQFLLPFQFAGL